ncbi:putative transcription factor interactor and regulator CCHC(Zn) family [Senna tora]|uniref:Putative transcription factor interactor and regulator CCHC(Zn) family n=1 Tax=Senna tora TaxID=362788 RepID=A0A835CKG0_9FABA|nr:putative transcription factor interactor and regulator CCHC(Zn) family [Senna tora]
MLFNSASQRCVVWNLLLLQYLGGVWIRVCGFCSLPQNLLQSLAWKLLPEIVVQMTNTKSLLNIGEQTSQANNHDPVLVIFYKLDCLPIKNGKSLHCIDKLLLATKDGAKLEMVIYHFPDDHWGQHTTYHSYHWGRLEDSLRPVVNDKQAMETGQLGLVVGMVDLYLLHTPFEYKEILALSSNEPLAPQVEDDYVPDEEGSEDERDEVDAHKGGNDDEDHKEDDHESDDLDDDSKDDNDEAVDIRFGDSRRMDKAIVEPKSDEEVVTVPTGTSTSEVRELSDEEYSSEELHSESERSNSEEEDIAMKKFPRWKEEKCNMELKKGKARKAKLLAMEKIHGSNAKQFRRLHDCCHEIGLLPAIIDLLPNVEQRFCVRLLYNNFRMKFPGQTLKEILWKAAKATYPAEWERAILEMKAVDEEAYKHLIQTPPRYWSKSRFQTTQRCDALLNMSKNFNSVIVDVREKPIVTMLEEIRST